MEWSPSLIAVSQARIPVLRPGGSIITCASRHGPTTANAAHLIGITACSPILLGLGRPRCPQTMQHYVAKKWPPWIEAAQWPCAPYPCHASSATSLWWPPPHMAPPLTRGLRRLWSWRTTNPYSIKDHHPGDSPCSRNGLPSASHSAYPSAVNLTWPISTDAELRRLSPHGR